MTKLHAGKLYRIAHGPLGFQHYTKRHSSGTVDVSLNEGDVVMYLGFEQKSHGFVCGSFLAPNGEVLCRWSEQDDFMFFIEARKKP